MKRHETVWLSASQWKIMADHHVVGPDDSFTYVPPLIISARLCASSPGSNWAIRDFVEHLRSCLDEGERPAGSSRAWLVATLTFWAPVLVGWSWQQVVSSYKAMDTDSTCHLAVTMNRTARTAVLTHPVRWSSRKLLPAGLLQATPLSWQSTTKDRLF